MAKNICIVGAARMDLQVRAQRLPQIGETELGTSYTPVPGGRGLIQAVACSRLGAKVSFVGCIGDDAFGAELRTVLTADGVDIQHLRRSEEPTGVGLITTLPTGRSAVTLGPGANGALTQDDVEEAAKEIRAADLLILQSEVPQEANLHALEIAKETTEVVFHASPAAGFDASLLQDVRLLVTNPRDSAGLLGDAAGDVSPAGLARRLACLGAERVVLHLDEEGAIHFNGEDVKTIEPVAGEFVCDQCVEDAFLAALAVARSEGARLKDAAALACAAAAHARATPAGLASLATREKLEEMLERDAR